MTEPVLLKIEPMKIDQINLEDVCWSLHLPNSFKRSLIRYFRPRIMAGEGVQDAAVAEIDPEPLEPLGESEIERLSWHLADTAIEAIETYTQDECGLGECPSDDADQAVMNHIEQAIGDATETALNDFGIKLA